MASVTCAAYKAALALLERDMPPKHRLLLECHYRAPRHTVTARSLARSVGYASYGAVNLQYGTLARKICDILGQRLEYHVLIVAKFVQPKSGEILWIMRPALARGLEDGVGRIARNGLEPFNPSRPRAAGTRHPRPESGDAGA
jgi:hypothetical protein